jgi:hypothetical protein
MSSRKAQLEAARARREAALREAAGRERRRRRLWLLGGILVAAGAVVAVAIVVSSSSPKKLKAGRLPQTAKVAANVTATARSATASALPVCRLRS